MLPASFHPATRAWFTRTFGAPTGSGKTLAAFLAALDSLVEASQAAPLPDAIHVVYVSPLKALSSDVQRNLEAPLAGIRAAAMDLGLEPPPIRTALRTGDTTPSARAAILKQAPHVLITTPESLYLMLTAARPRELLRSVRTVVVDE